MQEAAPPVQREGQAPCWAAWMGCQWRWLAGGGHPGRPARARSQVATASCWTRGWAGRSKHVAAYLQRLALVPGARQVKQRLGGQPGVGMPDTRAVPAQQNGVQQCNLLHLGTLIRIGTVAVSSCQQRRWRPSQYQQCRREWAHSRKRCARRRAPHLVGVAADHQRVAHIERVHHEQKHHAAGRRFLGRGSLG